MAIILFKSISKITNDEVLRLNNRAIWSMIGNFFTVCLFSVLVGILFGALTALIFKFFRFFKEHALNQTVIILMLGFFSYKTSEILGQSGVITLLTCGIVVSSYCGPNLSRTGVLTTGSTLQIASTISEAFLFIYLGMSAWIYFQED